jgi:hypothetical protein
LTGHAFALKTSQGNSARTKSAETAQTEAAALKEIAYATKALQAKTASCQNAKITAIQTGNATKENASASLDSTASPA